MVDGSGTYGVRRCHRQMLSFLFREHSQRTASIMVFVASSFWGLLWVPMRMTESMGVAPLWVQFWFTSVPALLLAFVSARATLRERAYWGIYIAAGMCISMGFTLYALGLLLASVSKTTALFYLTPIWSAIIAKFVLGEQAGMRRWTAIGLAVIGCCLVMQISPFAIAFETRDLLGLMSGVFWAISKVVMRGYPQIDFRNATFMQYLCGGMIAGVAILVLGPDTPQPLASGKAMLMGLIFGGMVFLPSVLLTLRVMQYLSPALVGILMLSEVLVAVISAMIFLGETLSIEQGIGIVVILVAGFVVATSKETHPQESSTIS